MQYAMLIYETPGSYDDLDDAQRAAIYGEYMQISADPACVGARSPDGQGYPRSPAGGVGGPALTGWPKAIPALQPLAPAGRRSPDGQGYPRL